MDKKAAFKLQLFLGVVVIATTIYLTFRYLLKGSPFIKLLAIGLVAAVSYLVINYLIRKSKEIQ